MRSPLKTSRKFKYPYRTVLDWQDQWKFRVQVTKPLTTLGHKSSEIRIFSKISVTFQLSHIFSCRKIIISIYIYIYIYSTNYVWEKIRQDFDNRGAKISTWIFNLSVKTHRNARVKNKEIRIFSPVFWRLNFMRFWILRKSRSRHAKFDYSKLNFT